jgi:hypothetical protein
VVDAGGWNRIVAALWREFDRGEIFGKTTKEVFEIEVAEPQAPRSSLNASELLIVKRYVVRGASFATQLFSELMWLFEATHFNADAREFTILTELQLGFVVGAMSR